MLITNLLLWLGFIPVVVDYTINKRLKKDKHRKTSDCIITIEED